MAKLNRESKLRDKRAEKEQRKADRKSAATSDAQQPATDVEELEAPSGDHGNGAVDGTGPESVAAISGVGGPGA